MGYSNWEDLQQNPEREVCLGNWHGWQGLWVLNIQTFLPLPLIVKMVSSKRWITPVGGYCRPAKDDTKTLLWSQMNSCSVYIHELVVCKGEFAPEPRSQRATLLTPLYSSVYVAAAICPWTNNYENISIIFYQIKYTKICKPSVSHQIYWKNVSILIE